MANYAPIRPKKGEVLTIPASDRLSMIVAVGGEVLLSTDLTFDAGRAVPLAPGKAVEMPANTAWICAVRDQGPEIRRMDIDANPSVD